MNYVRIALAASFIFFTQANYANRESETGQKEKIEQEAQRREPMPLLRCLSQPQVLLKTPIALALLACGASSALQCITTAYAKPTKWASIFHKATLTLVMVFGANAVMKDAFKVCNWDL